MGDAYPELRRNRDAIVRVVRSEEERFDAVLTAGLPRLEEALDRAAAAGTVAARRGSVPALRLARRAARLHGGPRRPARPARSIARATSARWRASAKARAGQHVQGRREGARVDDDRRSSKRALRTDRRQFEGYETHAASRACRSSRCSTSQGQPADELARGRTRATSRSPNAVLRRGRRPGLGHRADRRRGRRGGASSSGSSGRAATGRGCTRPRRQRDASTRRRSSPPRSPTRCATRRAATTRRRTCSTRRCARCSART